MTLSPCFKCSYLLAFATIVAAAGCGSSTEKQPPAPTPAPAAAASAPVAAPVAAPATDPVAEAGAILKLALDSWTFGDSREKFEQANPTIDFGDVSRWYDDTGELLRYEILNGRATQDAHNEIICETNVNLTFSGANGQEIKKGRRYKILKMKQPINGKIWMVGAYDK